MVKRERESEEQEIGSVEERDENENVQEVEERKREGENVGDEVDNLLSAERVGHVAGERVEENTFPHSSSSSSSSVSSSSYAIPRDDQLFSNTGEHSASVPCLDRSRIVQKLGNNKRAAIDGSSMVDIE